MQAAAEELLISHLEELVVLVVLEAEALELQL
jgi:hypothetical protein